MAKKLRLILTIILLNAVLAEPPDALEGERLKIKLCLTCNSNYLLSITKIIHMIPYFHIIFIDEAIINAMII